MATIYTRAAKGSALTWTEGDANITNLNNAKIENVVEDTTPQLGGDLDVNGHNITNTGAAALQITGASNYNVAIRSTGTGNVALVPVDSGKVVIDGLSWPTSDGSANQVLKTDGAGNLSWVAQTTDTNTTYSISAETATGGANLRLTDSGAVTDDVKLAQGTGITVSRTDANTITIASTVTSGITDVIQDTTPQLGGDLDVNGYKITDSSGTTAFTITSNTDKNLALRSQGTGNVVLIPLGTGKVTIDGLSWPTADGSADQVLKTDGSGNLSWTTVTSAYPQITDDTSTNGTRYILFDNVTSGDASSVGVSSTKLTFNPSTGVLSATGFSGAVNGSVGATTPSTGTFTTLTVNAANDLRLADSDSSNYVGFKAPATVSANKIWTLPSADGTANQVLKTDGSGTLSWTTVTASPAGSNQQIQYNNSGVLGASAGLYYDGTSFKCSSGNIESLYSNGDEGGEFRLATAASNTTLAGGSVAIDIYQNRLRIFETGGSTRGVYLDLTGAANTVGSALAVQGTTSSFTALTATTSASLKAINEGALYDLGTTGGTIAPNVANGNVQKITLNSALTINAFTSPVAGQSLTLIIYGGTSYTSITSTMKFAGGVKTLTGTASCIDILSVYYDGTNPFAKLAK